MCPKWDFHGEHDDFYAENDDLYEDNDEFMGNMMIFVGKRFIFMGKNDDHAWDFGGVFFSTESTEVPGHHNDDGCRERWQATTNGGREGGRTGHHETTSFGC